MSGTRLVEDVRYVGFAVTDMEAARRFYTSAWQLTPVEDSEDVAFLRGEGPEPFILRLRRADDVAAEIIGLAAPDRAAVDTAAEEFAAAGVRIAAPPAELTSPGGGYGFRFFDPDGRLTEISADVERQAERLPAPRDSRPFRVQHIVLNSPEPERLVEFYESRLGFVLSDLIGDYFSFLRCGPDHHRIAIVRSQFATLNHVAFDTLGVEEFLRAAGNAVRSGAELIFGPGRHGTGDNTFAYFRDPNGIIVEFSGDIEQIDDEKPREPEVHEITPFQMDQWGTAGDMQNLFAAGQATAPDPSLWQPSPI